MDGTYIMQIKKVTYTPHRTLFNITLEGQYGVMISLSPTIFNTLCKILDSYNNQNLTFDNLIGKYCIVCFTDNKAYSIKHLIKDIVLYL